MKQSSKDRRRILRDVPNQPKTPVTGFRIPTELKSEAMRYAAEEGKTLTDVVIEDLQRYVETRRLLS